MEMATSIGETRRSVAPPGKGFSAEEVRQFERDGYVIARKAADPDVCRRMREVIDAALATQAGPVEYEADLRYPGAPGSRADSGGNTIRRLKEAHGRDPVFTQWVASPSLILRLQQLLGKQLVMPLAHHNCIMTKHPDYSSQTGWHQDIRYWSFERPELVSVWLALGRETPQNGCLYLIPGTHCLQLGRQQTDEAQFLRPELPENAALTAQKTA